MSAGFLSLNVLALTRTSQQEKRRQGRKSEAHGFYGHISR